MSAKSNSKRGGRLWWTILALVIAVPVLYYGVQIGLRSAPLGAFTVIGHRGGRTYAPENTLAAFRNAIQMGSVWLEFDVQMTRDGVLVVMHDDTVDRTTNGHGAVADLTLDQIRALDAGHGEKVPTFQEVLDLAKASGADIFPETKSAHLYPGIEEKMLAALEQADYLDHTVIQSFEPDSLKKLRQLNPQARLCALYGLWQFSDSQPAGSAEYVCPMGEMVVLNPYMIRQAHNEGRRVLVWFGALQYPFFYQWVEFFGADGIIADDPLAVRQTIPH
jgi:glycerophosphoryl diester phosphodiesterase